MVKTKKKKRDLIPIALFQIMFQKRIDMDKLRKEIVEHLVENYIMNKSCNHHSSSFSGVLPPEESWESFVDEYLWDDSDAEQFDKELKKISKRK